VSYFIILKSTKPLPIIFKLFLADRILSTSRLRYSVASVCPLYGMYCG